MSYMHVFDNQNSRHIEWLEQRKMAKAASKHSWDLKELYREFLQHAWHMHIELTQSIACSSGKSCGVPERRQVLSGRTGSTQR